MESPYSSFTMNRGLMLLGVSDCRQPRLLVDRLSAVLSDSFSCVLRARRFFQAMAGHYTLLAIRSLFWRLHFMSDGGVAKRSSVSLSRWSGHFPGGFWRLAVVLPVWAFLRPCPGPFACNSRCHRLHRDRGDA